MNAREQAEAAETIEVLLDALRPFASAADNFDSSEDPGEFWRPDDDADGVVSIAHLRAARAAVRKATS